MEKESKNDLSFKIEQGTIIRTAALILAIINNLLALFGKSPLPIADETLSEVIAFIFTTITALVAWWKNNDFTEAAMQGTALMRMIKRKAKTEKQTTTKENDDNSGNGDDITKENDIEGA